MQLSQRHRGKGHGTLIRKMGGYKPYYEYLRNGGKFERNKPCPCGSGIKYKKCSLKKHL